MAQRKKTPDVLADQQPPPRRTARTSVNKTSPQIPQSLNAESSIPPADLSFDPLATLFPRPADVQPAVPVAVKLTVTAPKALAGEVESGMAQALRTLPHVRLVTEEADWHLVILSVAVQAPSRTPHGVALSVVVVNTSTRRVQSQSGMESVSPQAVDAERLSFFHGAWLRVAARSQLPKLCAQIVADFDTRYLAQQHRPQQTASLVSTAT